MTPNDNQPPSGASEAGDQENHHEAHARRMYHALVRELVDGVIQAQRRVITEMDWLK